MNGPLLCELCELLLKIHEFWKKSSGGNPIWGQNFSKFSLPKTSPNHLETMGEKKIQNQQNGNNISFLCLTGKEKILKLILTHRKVSSMLTNSWQKCCAKHDNESIKEKNIWHLVT